MSPMASAITMSNLRPSFLAMQNNQKFQQNNRQLHECRVQLRRDIS